MHWFWRVLIASVIGFIATILVYAGIVAIQGRSPTEYLSHVFARWTVLISVATTSPSILFYMLLARRFGPVPPVADESLCRECGYILRGLREPRCPECGERL